MISPEALTFTLPFGNDYEMNITLLPDKNPIASTLVLLVTNSRQIFQGTFLHCELPPELRTAFKSMEVLYEYLGEHFETAV